ncbi:hypothetical protein PsAD2_00400 [Pseudovibrio axinellae]|uniref:DUF2460 domain-containing protein n=1 Tax=Pseudovibrio axinellae TaxID=989403 RepID=A0A166AHF1_9HYPH|nr:DUF2460 domain-containing protein [Pseudovibrio axinellae]KZL21116.1 hypothetical protein PsAD2_00400 [Pseudovibrio axinellae]SEQ88212.1 TIGR02217 family protein [Pseudovibrio axinellae]
MLTEFHDTRFPPDISLGAKGGPERKTQIVIRGNGRENRNQQWADSRRRYNAAKGVRSVNDLYQVIAFFEERRGRMFAFRWKDWSDYKSCAPGDQISAADQIIGVGDGAQTQFQLIKTYGAAFAPYARSITLPDLEADHLVALDGVMTAGFETDPLTGVVTFENAPDVGVQVTAGFQFDVPARFDSDILEVSLAAHTLGSVPNIPVVEVL